MSQLQSSVLFDTDPLLRQSIVAIGMPEPLEFRFPTKLVGNIATVGLVAASVIGVVDGRGNDSVEAAYDNRADPGQTDCVYVGNPGDIAIVNSTIVEPEQPGFATVGPAGYDWRAYSTNNYGLGGASPNLTATEMGPSAEWCSTAQQRAHKLGDIVGFIDGSVFKRYNNSPTPVRIMDTRGGPKPAAGQTDCVYVGNPGDIAIVNSTIVEPEQPGFATVGPAGYDWRAYSTNNYGLGGASPNLTATEIGPNGQWCTTAQQRAHKLGDIVGFIDGSVFKRYNNSPTPTRIMDTRQNLVPTSFIQTSAEGPGSVTPNQLDFKCYFVEYSRGGVVVSYQRRFVLNISGLNPDTNPDPAQYNGDNVSTMFSVERDSGLGSTYIRFGQANESGIASVNAGSGEVQKDIYAYTNNPLEVRRTTPSGSVSTSKFLVSSQCINEGVIAI